MIIERNVQITNRKMLKLAIAQTQKDRDEQLKLLVHNSEAIQQKWTLQRITSSLINATAPSLFGGMMIYVTSFFSAVTGDSKEGESGHWKTILIDIIKSIVSRFAARNA